MEGDFSIHQWLIQPQLNAIISPDGETLQLEPKVIEVLVYLAEHANEVLARERILQAIWPDTFVTDEVLTHAISEIRKAFGDDAKTPRFVQTIPKRGYRLIAPVVRRPDTASRYELLEKLGDGTRVEVFLAWDTEMQRKVALKLFRADGGEAGEERIRLLRAARKAADLEHPGIGRIYDAGQTDGMTFIAAEHAEGQSLNQRLGQGPLPLKEALRIGVEVAGALAAAHDKGVLHGDLSPSKVILTPQGRVKVVDFGLTECIRRPEASVRLGVSVSAVTEAGPAAALSYMSPEQLRAEAIDRRSDIFALGVLLFELLTGEHPFLRSSSLDTAAVVLDAEPDWDRLATNAPAGICSLLQRCLQKDKERRPQDINDVRLEIEEALARVMADQQDSHRVAARTDWTVVRLVALVSLLLGSSITGFLLWSRKPSPGGSVGRVYVSVQPARQLGGGGGLIESGRIGLERPSRTAMALSSDGSKLFFRGFSERGTQLYLRRMDRWDAVAIPGTENGYLPLLSPDGKWLAYASEENREWSWKKIQVDGGTPLVLCGGLSRICGASWGSDQWIFFDQAGKGIWKVSDTGGQPEQLTTPDREKGELWHVLPETLPGGKAVLFTIRDSHRLWDNPKIAALSLDTGQYKVLLEEGADARYVPTGHVVFADRGMLKAVAFDPERLEVKGAPVPILEGVMQAINGSNEVVNSYAALFVFSASGTLAYVSGGVYPERQFVLEMVTREGNARILTNDPRPYVEPRISPDGKQVVHSLYSQSDGNIYLLDIASGRSIPLTSYGNNIAPLWTPDGRNVIYSQWLGGEGSKVFLLPADRSAEPKLLTESDHVLSAASWSPEGDYLAFVEKHPATDYDIWVMRMKDKERIPIACTEAREGHAAFSPNGRWIAYSSDQLGQRQVFVQPFPPTGRIERVSVEPGASPVWGSDGRELFYREAGNHKIWVVDVATESDFAAGKPRVLFEYEKSIQGTESRAYDITRDSEFLLIKRIEPEPIPVTRINVVLNWFEDLKRLVPAGS